MTPPHLKMNAPGGREDAGSARIRRNRMPQAINSPWTQAPELAGQEASFPTAPVTESDDLPNAGPAVPGVMCGVPDLDTPINAASVTGSTSFALQVGSDQGAPFLAVFLQAFGTVIARLEGSASGSAFTPQGVPEPATRAQLRLGLSGPAARRRKRG